jgi:hypothetical protein
MNRHALEAEFIERLRERWRRGAEQYGDESFRRPLPETVEQILEELVDVGGWSLIAWQQVRERLARVANRSATIADLHGRAVAAECERDRLHDRLHAVAEELARAADAPTWAAIATVLAKAADLARGTPIHQTGPRPVATTETQS